MENEKNIEVLDVTVNEVEVVEKPSLKDKAKAGFAKVKNSKAAKVVGAVGLIAVGAIGAVVLSNKGEDETTDDVDDMTYIDLENEVENN